jgi:hypothetical protein
LPLRQARGHMRKTTTGADEYILYGFHQGMSVAVKVPVSE